MTSGELIEVLKQYSSETLVVLPGMDDFDYVSVKNITEILVKPERTICGEYAKATEKDAEILKAVFLDID